LLCNQVVLHEFHLLANRVQERPNRCGVNGLKV
jgi:hypothetical protein